VKFETLGVTNSQILRLTPFPSCGHFVNTLLSSNADPVEMKPMQRSEREIVCIGAYQIISTVSQSQLLI